MTEELKTERFSARSPVQFRLNMFPSQLSASMLLFFSVQHVHSSTILPNFTTGAGTNCNVTIDHYDCCYYIQRPIELDLCISFDYLPNEYDVELNVMVNNKDIINKKVAVRNPPPICGQVALDKLAEVCFYLNVNKTEVDLCMKVEFEVARKDIFDVHLGCYKILIGPWSLIPKSSDTSSNELHVELKGRANSIGFSRNSCWNPLGLANFIIIIYLIHFVF